MIYLEWTATALGIIGALLVAHQMVAGFMVWIVANILWMIFAGAHRKWGMLTLFAVYTAISAYSIYQWGCV